MLIAEDIRQCWMSALENLSVAEELDKEGNFHEAVDKAIWAVILGSGAATKLSEELKDAALKDTASSVLADWVERRMAVDGGKRHCTTKETLQWAVKSLQRLYDAAPLDVLPPLR